VDTKYQVHGDLAQSILVLQFGPTGINMKENSMIGIGMGRANLVSLMDTTS
tara:strand:+ start:234 stop:386 length:153 start_codon:yes stop_codon:yes gene_type:complete